MSDLLHTGSRKKAVIRQPNYIPWKSYFDFINAVDEFVLSDDVQFTRRGWHNQNVFKAQGWLYWFKISVESEREEFSAISLTPI